MRSEGCIWIFCLLQEVSDAERRRIQAEFERLRRLLAEQERTVLARLAELDDTFAATHAEKSLRVAEGVAQLHRLIGQLEARCLPQVSARPTPKALPQCCLWDLELLFSPLLGCWEHPKQVCATGCFTSLPLQLRRGASLIYPSRNTCPCPFFSHVE